MVRNIFKEFIDFFKKKEIKKVVVVRDNRRSFTRTQKTEIWYRQKSKCKSCKTKLDLRTVVYDHIKRWSQGGDTSLGNCQALCPNCHNMKNFEENLSLVKVKKKR